MRLRLLAVSMLLAVAALCAAFHPANVASARAKVEIDGNVDLLVRFDVLAFMVDERPSDVGDAPMKALLELPAATLDVQLKEAAQRFRSQLRIAGGGTIDSLDFPTSADVAKWVKENGKQSLPAMLAVSVKGHLAPGAQTSSFAFPEVLGSVVLTTEFPYQEPYTEPVEAGQTSTALNVPTAAAVAAAKAQVGASRTEVKPKPEKPMANNAPTQAPSKPAPEPPKARDTVLPSVASEVKPSSPVPDKVTPPKKNDLPPAAKPAEMVSPAQQEPKLEAAIPSVDSETAPLNPRPAWYAVLPSYVHMGFVHILPEGLDHILFVLGLFLLSPRTKDLLKQITAFTVAHSLTLALAMFGVVRLPSSIVEPLIALSIVFVAVENIFTSKMKSWRPYVVFGFGLIHGLGFAGALQDLGLKRGDFLTALVGFNCGVELGQLTVVAAALLLVGWFRSNQRYRPWVAVPASIAIGVVALFWTIERIW